MELGNDKGWKEIDADRKTNLNERIRRRSYKPLFKLIHNEETERNPEELKQPMLNALRIINQKYAFSSDDINLIAEKIHIDPKTISDAIKDNDTSFWPSC